MGGQAGHSLVEEGQLLLQTPPSIAKATPFHEDLCCATSSARQAFPGITAVAAVATKPSDLETFPPEVSVPSPG